MNDNGVGVMVNEEGDICCVCGLPCHAHCSVLKEASGVTIICSQQCLHQLDVLQSGKFDKASKPGQKESKYSSLGSPNFKKQSSRSGSSSSSSSSNTPAGPTTSRPRRDNTAGPAVGPELPSGWQEYAYFQPSTETRFCAGVFVSAYDSDAFKFVIMKVGTIRPGSAKGKTRRVVLLKHVTTPASVWCSFVPLTNVAIVNVSSKEVKFASNTKTVAADTTTVKAIVHNDEQRLHS
jgi:hypothetical protein